MKIICNQADFAVLVRECAANSVTITNGKPCDGCLFSGLCDTSLKKEYGFMKCIEDICEISNDEE